MFLFPVLPADDRVEVPLEWGRTKSAPGRATDAAKFASLMLPFPHSNRTDAQQRASDGVDEMPGHFSEANRVTPFRRTAWTAGRAVSVLHRQTGYCAAVTGRPHKQFLVSPAALLSVRPFPFRRTDTSPGIGSQRLP